MAEVEGIPPPMLKPKFVPHWKLSIVIRTTRKIENVRYMMFLKVELGQVLGMQSVC
jgi:hypothetical protein